MGVKHTLEEHILYTLSHLIKYFYKGSKGNPNMTQGYCENNTLAHDSGIGSPLLLESAINCVENS